MIRGLLVLAVGLCLAGCEDTTLKERIIGQWEKVSGQMRRGGAMRVFKPGEVILEYKADNKLVAVWDNEPHYYEWWVMDQETIKKRDESGNDRFFTYQFEEDGTLFIVEVGSGIKSRFRRLE